MNGKTDRLREHLVIDVCIIYYVLGWENVFDLMFPVSPDSEQRRRAALVAVRGDTVLVDEESRRWMMSQFMPTLKESSFRLVRDEMIRRDMVDQFEAVCLARKIDEENYLDLCSAALEAYGQDVWRRDALEIPGWLRSGFPEIPV